MKEMKLIDQKRTRAGQIFPSPRDGETVSETPPCLSWLKCAGCSSYTVEIYRDGELFWRGETDKNYIVPDTVLPAGEYKWEIFAGEGRRGIQSFFIGEEAVEFIRPTARELLDAVKKDGRHPRLMFMEEDKAEIIAEKRGEIEVLKRNIALALSRPLPEPPLYHRDPDALPYREYFGRFRDYCDRDLIALSIGYALLGDEEAGKRAKLLLLIFSELNPDGPCSLLSRMGDEIGLSLARCLPTAYDLLYPLLDDYQRGIARATIEAYASQCEKRLTTLDFCQNPGNSHSGRVPAYLGEAAIVLAGSDAPEEALLRRLTLALDIYGGIFPYFGGSDGGWAEGPFYASSYTKWYLPFFLAVERFTGKAFLCRPFYQRYIHFIAHFMSPGQELHPFGDGYWCRPDDEEWPGFFAQNPYGIYARRCFAESPSDRALMLERQSAIKPEIFKLHLLDIFVPDKRPSYKSLDGKLANLRAFPESGFVSAHTSLFTPEKDVVLLARASRYGAYSHQHPDQGSFALFGGGVALITPSGYFGRQYGSRHHKFYTNTTAAHNCILVNGEGQKPFSHETTGRIISCGERQTRSGKVYEFSLDLIAAYPMLKSYTRTFTLREDTLTVRDETESEDDCTLTFMLHSLSRPSQRENQTVIERGGYRLTVTPLEGELSRPQITDFFPIDLNDGEPEQYHVSMPPQFHISMKTPPNRKHTIVTQFQIETM